MAWRRGRALDNLENSSNPTRPAETSKTEANENIPLDINNNRTSLDIDSLLSNDTLPEEKPESDETIEETLRKPNDDHVWHEEPVDWNKDDTWFLRAMKEQVGFHMSIFEEDCF